MKENKERWFLSLDHRPRHLPGEPSSRKTPSGSSRPTATRATSSRRSASPSCKYLERLHRREDALGRAADPGRRGRALPRRQLRPSPATRSSRPTRCSRSSRLKEGDYYSQKKIRKGFQKAQEVYGVGRLLGVHRLSRPSSRDDPRPRPSRRRRPALGRRPRQPSPRLDADRRRHDADPGGQAVLRQPHHLRRQHDDPRQRDPARDAALREQRLQHRGAEDTASSGSISSATSRRSKGPART